HQARICLVLGAVDDHAHLKALLELNHLLHQETFRERLGQAQTSAEVIRIFWSSLMNLGPQESASTSN
ncbi:MAG TPA: hypothetical protein DCE76_01640, partial [Anaerolineaceae bacterium]|nr:hypothetical protein [Anaerolineaceae bacterium]